MQLSNFGAKMSTVSGVRRILDDIQAATSGADRSEWLNLGVGNPAQISEVTQAWRELTLANVEERFTDAATRYGPTRGSVVLIDAIIDYFGEKFGWGLEPDNILVAPGNQMLCFIATTVFTGPTAEGHARLALPSVPDYTGYQSLSLAQDGIVGIEPRIEMLDGRRFRYAFDFDALQRTERIGAILLSDPCNPSGRAMTVSERDGLIDIACARGVPLIVDHAYGSPFPGVTRSVAPPVFHDNVVNCFTLSKAGLPGERLGFGIGPKHLIAPMSSFMSNSVLHAPQLVQATVASALATRRIDAMVEQSITAHYEVKRAIAEKLLDASLGTELDWHLHTSTGGMFCWLWIRDEWFDGDAFYQSLKSRKVCIVPGASFFVDGHAATPRSALPVGSGELETHARQCIRLSLSADEAVVTEAIGRIAEALNQHSSPVPV